MSTSRGFSLLEMMIVLGIVGILASIAIPNLTTMARHYRGMESARGVVGAVAAARGLAQRNNAPVELTIFADHAELATAQTAAAPEDVRKVISSFTVTRSIPFGIATASVLKNFTGSTTVATQPAGATAKLIFCGSSDAYFRVVVGGVEQPACTAGNLSSANARIAFSSASDAYYVEVKAPLASVELKRGAAP